MLEVTDLNVRYGTVEALREHRRHVERLTHDVVAIATSAVRRADNAQAFSDAVRETTGAPLRVIDGEEEARCSFTGAVAVAPLQPGVTTYGVVDPGGGSTEYATGERAMPRRTFSRMSIRSSRIRSANCSSDSSTARFTRC